MSTKSLRRTIRRVESQLAWPVVLVTHDGPLDIISDPDVRVHTIRFPVNPSPDDPVRDIEYLHELAHAMLAEREPVFCVHEFCADPDDLPVLSDSVRVTADWFADYLVMLWAPEEQFAYIAEHVELMRRLVAEDLPQEFELAAGHIFAQGEYFGMKIPFSETVDPTVNMFLSVDPARPTEQNFSKLFNMLLAESHLQAEWVAEERAWLVKKIMKEEL